MSHGLTVKVLKRCLLFAAVCGSLAATNGVAPAAASEKIRQNLFDACFLNDDEGWVVGELGRVLHTSDGGKTFETLPLGTRHAFTSIVCFPDRRLLIAGPGGMIRRSLDGGRTWQTLETKTNRHLLSLAFVSPERGIAVGDFGTILRTDDGGDTWQTIPIPTKIPLPEWIAETIAPGDILLYDAHFVSPEEAWIVGEFGVILSTTDGGKTWAAHKSPVETTLFGVTFTDRQHGWAVGLESVMLRTQDGGATWAVQKIPAPPGLFLSLYDVAIVGKTGWAVGDSGFVLHSADAGETWTRVEVPLTLAGSWLRGISLTTDRRGIIVGSEGLVLFTNGDKLESHAEPLS